MKTIAILAVLFLTGCGSADYYKSPSDIARDNAWDDATSSAMIANGFNRHVTCMNIGGIVTCQ